MNKNNNIGIKNVQAGEIYEYNKGIRDYWTSTKAVLSDSLFSRYMVKNGLKVSKKQTTKDIICIKFGFGTNDYETEIDNILNSIKDIFAKENNLDKKDKEFKKNFINAKENLENFIDDIKINKEDRKKFKLMFERCKSNEDKYEKVKKDDIRKEYYNDKVKIKYEYKDKKGNIKDTEIIEYQMLYRTPSKAKVGSCVFINTKFYDIAYNWLTMGLSEKLKNKEKAKLVELSAYAPLTTSTIIDTIHIDPKQILIVDDQDSFFTTMANIVNIEDREGKVKVLNEEKTKENILQAEKEKRYSEKTGKLLYKKVYDEVTENYKVCTVSKEECKIKNTLWDGMSLVEADWMDKNTEEQINGMALLRNHFFKSCSFKGYLSKFIKKWCEDNGHDYETYEVQDKFELWHYVKDIKLIATDNSCKWLKFKDLMGNTDKEAYEYWCNIIKDDGCEFGIVKTDHKSKLGNIQQMSYQMVNTLVINKLDEMNAFNKTTLDYVKKLKDDDESFEEFLKNNASAVNHYEMLAELYNHNNSFAKSKFFSNQRSKIISEYVTKLRGGKILQDGDNITVVGNPIALLYRAMGDEYTKDDCFKVEKDAIQCYTTRFDPDEYLCAFRSPHNAPHNIMHLHNVYPELMKEYFSCWSDNIICINLIGTDAQPRANGYDMDSDFFDITRQKEAVKWAKECYKKFNTIVNKIEPQDKEYKNEMNSYSEMDNKFAKSQNSIGESSNLAQLAMTYYWNESLKEKPDEDILKDLEDNVIILSCVAQLAIDGCKKVFEIEPEDEIKRIRKMDCMKQGKPIFMLYTKDSKKDDTEEERLLKSKVLLRKEFYTLKYKLQELDKEIKELNKNINNTKDKKQIAKLTDKISKLNKKRKDLEDNRNAKISEKLKTIDDQLSEIENKKYDENLKCPMNLLQESLSSIPNAKSPNRIDTIKFFIKMEGKADSRQMKKVKELVADYDNYIKELNVNASKKGNDDEEYNSLINIKFNDLFDSLPKNFGNQKTINRLIEITLEVNANGKSKKDKDEKVIKMLNTLYQMCKRQDDKDKFLNNFCIQTIEK